MKTYIKRVDLVESNTTEDVHKEGGPDGNTIAIYTVHAISPSKFNLEIQRLPLTHPILFVYMIQDLILDELVS